MRGTVIVQVQVLVQLIIVSPIAAVQPRWGIWRGPRTRSATARAGDVNGCWRASCRRRHWLAALADSGKPVSIHCGLGTS